MYTVVICFWKMQKILTSTGKMMKISILANLKILFSQSLGGGLILLLSACGGGGSGGGESSSGQNDFSLNLNPKQISAQCFEYEFCEVKIRATYQGALPAGSVYVISTLDNNVQNFYYDINDTYTDITFGLGHYVPKGNYIGQVSIDVCADVNCANRYGSRYTIPYTWKVMSNWPTFHLGVVGSNDLVESNNELRLSGNMGESSPLYELTVEMPGTATSLNMPQEFIDLYKVNKISETVYQLQLPEGGRSSKNYAFIFSGPGFNNLIDVTVHVNMKRNMTPLPLQVVSAVFYETFESRREVAVGNYGDGLCGTMTEKLTIHNGNDWVSISDGGGCSVSLVMNPPTDGYGFYEATLTVDSPAIEDFELPVVMSYSKNKLEYNTSGYLSITPTTTEESLSGVNWFQIYSGDTNLLVSPVSTWIKDMTLSASHETSQTYDYRIDIDELKKINPMNSGTSYWNGIIKIDNTDPNGDVGVGEIDLHIEVPFIYSMAVKSIPAHLPFTQTLKGDMLNDFAGVDIVTLEQDEAGEYTKAVAKEYYYPKDGYTWDHRNGIITFQMPSMEAGVYQLNFAGILSHHFPRHILHVE